MVCQFKRQDLSFKLAYLHIVQIQNATDDLLLLECLRESAIGAIREHEVNLSVPVYLLSATVNRFEKRQVNSTVTEVELCTSKINHGQ